MSGYLDGNNSVEDETIFIGICYKIRKCWINQKIRQYRICVIFVMKSLREYMLRLVLSCLDNPR